MRCRQWSSFLLSCVADNGPLSSLVSLAMYVWDEGIDNGPEPSSTHDCLVVALVLLDHGTLCMCDGIVEKHVRRHRGVTPRLFCHSLLACIENLPTCY
jgi:hypothetical protein